MLNLSGLVISPVEGASAIFRELQVCYTRRVRHMPHTVRALRA